MRKLNRWIEAAELLLTTLSESGKLGECRFGQGDIEGCESPDYDDSSWKKVISKNFRQSMSVEAITEEDAKKDLPLSDWSMMDGPAALRKVVQVPDDIGGLSTSGTKINLVLAFLGPVDIFIDGKRKASFKYWGDTRECEVIITESFVPGTKHTIVAKTPKNDGDALIGTYLNVAIVEEAILELSTAIAQVKFAQRLLLESPSEEKEKALDSLGQLLCSKGVENRDWDVISKNFEDIDRVLVAFEESAKEYCVHMIGHAHIDMNWVWDMADTEDICVRDFSTICDIMDENPDMHFTQSQIAVYDIVHRIRPDLFERAKKKIAEGTWDMAAGTWTEHDLNTSTGEVFARHSLLSVKYAREMLDAKPSEVCWMPDNFGHPATTPNLMNKSGMKYYYHARKGQEYPLYWWEGTDGSRVLDFCCGLYKNAIRVDNIFRVLDEFADKLGMKNSMFVYGVGDHGGGPTRNDIRIKRYLDKKPVFPKLKFAGTHEFYEMALNERTDYPVHKGEQNFIFEGCYTTKTKIKKYLRDGENRLLDAEALMAYNLINGIDVSEDNHEAMEAWKHVLFNGFHDISCGCNIAEADVYDYKIGQEAIDTANILIGKHLAKVKENLTEPEGNHILVFNQLGHIRTDVVRVISNHKGSLIDSDGNVIPVQKSGDQIVFVAKDIPAFGYKAYRLSSEKTNQLVQVHPGSQILDGKVHVIETDIYRMEISVRTGTIVKLTHKLKGQEVLNSLKGVPECIRAFKGERSSNLLKVHTEEPHLMSSWVIGNIMKTENLLGMPEFTVVEVGDVFVCVKVARTYNDSFIEQYITLYNGLDRVDFTLDADWKELGDNKKGVPFMKVGFTVPIHTPRYVYEIPMGWIERKEQGCELPALRFVSLCDDDFGLNLYNDSKFGFSVEGGSVYMSVVRSAYAPDAKPDFGSISCKYAIQPSDGIKDIPKAVKEAGGFNQPLVAIQSGKPRGDVVKGLLAVDCDSIVVSTIKPAATGEGLVLRFLESAGTPTVAKISMDDTDFIVYETNFAEEPIRTVKRKDGVIEIPFGGFESKTLLLRKKC